MDIKDINRTIEELEKDSTTFENCQKIASLYIVRQNYETGLKSSGNRVKQELTDILPAYSKYVDTKRRFQLGELSEKVVEKHHNKVMICHVLRYVKFYQKAKEIINSGKI